MVADLKRIADKQLKEIVMLQKEIEIVKYNSSTGNSINQQFKCSSSSNNIELDNHLWSKTEDNFRSPCRQANNK
jgi:DNA repair exonuclease SbcCD ATPase subunit